MIEVAPLTLDDLETADALFTAYPFKRAQRNLQGLDSERLNAFYAQGLRRGVASGAPHWIVREATDGRPLALAGLTPVSSQSAIYGISMGRLQPWLNTERPDATHAVLLAAALEAARAQGVGHLSVRLDGEDFANLHAFEAAGWRLVDVSLKMTRPISGEGSPPAPPRPALVRGWTLASAEPSDAAWIRRLASQGHAGMHLMNDPALPREKTRALLADWIGRCLDRLAWRIFTLRDSEGKGRGFAIYLRAPAFAKAMGRRPLILDFVVLDPVVRGHGVGAWFLHESLTQCTAEGDFDYCELRTSAHNLTAVACYEQLGFCCCAHDLQLSRASLNASAF